MDALERYIKKRQKPIILRVLMSPDDRQRLAMLSTRMGMSQSAAVRMLIRQEAEAHGLTIDTGERTESATGAGR